MVYLRGLGYISSPQELLQNEWVLFVGVFLLVFAVVYISLANAFFKKKEQSLKDVLLGIKGNSPAKGPIVVISGVIALFSAAAIIQQDLVRVYFGAVLSVWVSVFVFIVLVLLTVPFYKALKQNIGKTPAILGTIIGFWVILKFVLPQTEMFWNGLYNLPYSVQNFYDFVVSPVFLIIALIVGFIVSKIGKK